MPADPALKNAFFETWSDMLSEADQLVWEDQPDSGDRAVLSAFYNGRQTMTDSEAEAQNVQEVTNHLLGYDQMAMAKAQIEAIFTRPREVWSIRLPGVPLQLRQKWGMAVTKNFNQVIKASGRLKPQVKSFAGDAVLFGRGSLMFRDGRDWCPKLMRPLVPRGTGTLAKDVPYAVVPSYISMNEFLAIDQRIKNARKSGVKIDWHGDAVAAAIECLKNNVSNGYFIATDSRQQPDEVEQDFQENKIMYSQYRTKLPVYYVYTSHPDLEGTPCDLTILARYSPTQVEAAEKKQSSLPTCLYERSMVFDRAEHWLHPVFIDASLDGEMTWHRVMGLGRLNYDNDVDVEQFFNDAMMGSRENLRRTYKVAGQADWDLVQRWNRGEYPANLLPPGVDVAEAAKNPVFQHALGAIEILRAQSSKNAGGGQMAQPTDQRKELQVQALERQGRNAETMGNRINDVYDAYDNLGAEIMRRLLADTPLPLDPGFEEVVRFQMLCQKDGVPIEVLRQLFEKQDGSVVIETNRTVGDGNQVREQMTNQFLMSTIHMYSPEAQEVIKRRVTASMTRDYDFAETVVPFQKKPDANQVARANEENNSCENRGITGYIPPYADDDIDAIHIQEHFGGMQALLARGKANQGWNMAELGAFKTLGAHTAGHIQRIGQNPQAKQLATKMMQALQGLARQGQEFANNLAKKQQAQQLDPVEQERLKLDQEKQQLSVRKQDDLVKHRRDVLKLQTRKAASGEVIAAAQVANAERQSHKKHQLDRVRLGHERVSLAHDMIDARRSYDLEKDRIAQDQRQFELGLQQDNEEPVEAEA